MNSTYPIVFMAALIIYFLLTSIHTDHEGQEIKEIWHGHVIWENSSEVSPYNQGVASELSPYNQGVASEQDTKTNLRSTSKEPFTVYEPENRPAIDFDKDIEEIRKQKPKEVSNLQPKINHSYDKIHKFLHNVDRAACKKWKVLIGENSKEPDVHICLDNISPPCVVYSFGIANNWIFDDYMISKGCHVYSFDPSMNVGKHKRHKNHLFEPIGIGIKSGVHEGRSTLYGDKTNYDVLTLADMMKRYNNDHVDIIRMDTEYAEWDVLQQWFKQGMFSKIDQLLLEIHMWPRTDRTNHGQVHSEILHSIPMTLFHEARNKWNNKRLAGDMTSVYEVGFITKSQSLENKKSSDPVKKFQDRASYNFNDLISGYAINSIKSLSTSTWLCDEILCEYYRNWRQKWNPKLENYTFDKYLLHRVIENHIDKYAYELPSADDIVMHIRLGDVSRTACFDYPHECRINSGKLPYQFTGNCYEDVLQRLPKSLTRIVLVSSNKWNPSDRRESDSYKIKLIRLLEEKGYEVIDRSNQYMDSDIAFVSHAKYLIGGGGGFAHTLKEQAKLNGAKQVWNAWHPWVQGQKCVWVDDSVEPKKIDIFHVNHEKAIWRMRFEEHWDFVDEFHIFESSVSHQGNPKRLYFKESRNEFKQYASKIVYHEINSDFNSDACKKKGNWECETHDRIEIAKTMNGILRDDDIVIFSDVDEFVFEDVLAKLGKQPSLLPTRIRTPVYKYSLHWKQQKSDNWKSCIVARGAYVKKYNEWNSLRRKNDIAAIIEHGGLHLSTFGSIDEIVTKSLHSRTKRILDRDDVVKRVNNGISLWDINNHFVYEENVPILPKLAKSDPGYFEEHFMRYGKTKKKPAVKTREVKPLETQIDVHAQNTVRACALLFFGLAKHFNDIVYPSIQKYILNTNPDCDIYAHTYDIKEITNPRNKEDHTPVNPLEVYSMTNNVVIDTLESVSKAIDFDYYHKHYKQTNGVFPYSMDNSLKQWFSIQRVWESMPSKYKRVGLFRLDVLYTEPIDIQNGDAVIPDFHHWGGINDRAFYGLYKWAKQWATARFKKLAIRSKQENIYDMHAETFVKYLMRDVPIELKPMCFKRVRATGEIKNDCKPSVPKTNVETKYIDKSNILMRTSSSLESLAGASGSDKARVGNGRGYHGYTRYYERIFKAIRKSSVRLLEIGVEKGRSMKMWQQYFSEAEHVYGIGYGNFQETPSQECDSNAATRVNSKTGCTIYKGDQSDVKFLNHFIKKTGGNFDVIIDDGSHVPKHQLVSFETLWPAVKPGGMYIVEDIETNWWKPTTNIYGYSLQNQPNVVEIWKGLVESVNREFTNGHSKLTDEKPDIYGNVVSVEFGQNIIIFHKALKGEETMLSKKYRFQGNLPRRRLAAQISLESLAGASGSDKARVGNGRGYHGYTRYYERIFKAIRKSSVRLLEIGVEKGRSMKMWQQYFSEAEHVYGIGYGNFQETPSQECDSNAATRVNSKTGCTIYKGDQSDVKFLNHFIKKTGGNFDVIIDDGSHVPKHQLVSFETLWPAVKPGGMYIVEDIETNWWKPTTNIYGYSLQNQPNVVEIWKGLVESVNREFTNGHSKLTDEKPDIYGNVVSVEFGQNIIIFHKALKGEETMLSKKYRYSKRLPNQNNGIDKTTTIFAPKSRFGNGKERGLTNQLWQFLVFCKQVPGEFISLESIRFRGWNEENLQFDEIWDVEHWNKNKPVSFPQIVNKKATQSFKLSRMMSSSAYRDWRGQEPFSYSNLELYRSFLSALQLKAKFKSSVDNWKSQQQGPYGCIHARVEKDMGISNKHMASRIKLKPLWSIMNDSPLLTKRVGLMKMVAVLNQNDLENDDLEFISHNKDPWGRPLLSTQSLHVNDVFINSAIDQYACQQGELFVGCQFSSFSYQVGHLMDFRNNPVFMYGRSAIITQISQMSDWKCLDDNSCLNETPINLNGLIPSVCLPIVTTEMGILIRKNKNRRSDIVIPPIESSNKCLIMPKLSKNMLELYDNVLGVRMADAPEGIIYGDLHLHKNEYTMVGVQRLNNFVAAIDEVNKKNIPGSIVELGVWRGGSMMVASQMNNEAAQMSLKKRDLYLFDAFEDIPGYGSNSFIKYLQVDESFVKDGFLKFGVMNEHVHFRKGLFQDTVPSWNKNDKIAVLRVDGNFYDSYQDVMYYMYENVLLGGIVIFDDVMADHSGVLQFWKDFKKEQKLVEEFNRIDNGSGWFRKIKNIKIDWKYFRAPQDVNRKGSCPSHIHQCHPSWSA